MWKITEQHKNVYFEADDEYLKHIIFTKTQSYYDGRTPKQERFGVRPSVLDKHLPYNFTTITGLYVLSVVRAVNNNSQTRYMIFGLNDNIPSWFCDYVNPCVPILAIHQTPNGGGEEELSSWFREHLGGAFSIIDIDFLIINKNNNLVLVEEKTHGGKTSYGQLKSYEEIKNDILVNIGLNETPTVFMAHVGDNELSYIEVIESARNYYMILDQASVDDVIALIDEV